MRSQLSHAGYEPPEADTGQGPPGPGGRLLAWLLGRQPHPRWRHLESQTFEEDRDGCWSNYRQEPAPDRLGICCSGGGVRSASFNLGALQVLRSEGVLGRTAYLAAVSGGAYIALAHAVTSALTLDADRRPTVMTPQQRDRLFPRDSAAWAPGSPEEQHLRHHTTYLAPGARGKLGFLLWLVVGLLGQLTPFLAASLAAGMLIAHLAAAVAADPAAVGPPTGTPALVTLIVTAVLAVAAGLCIIVRLWLERADQPRSDAGRDRLDAAYTALPAWARRLVVAGLGVLGAIFLLPWTLAWARDFTVAEVPWAVAAVSGVVAPVVLYLVRRSPTLTLGFARRVLLPAVGSLAGLTVLAAPGLAGAAWVLRESPPGQEWQAAVFIAAVVFLVAVLLLDDSAQPSMHTYYKERLASAFVSLRWSSATPGAGWPRTITHREPPWSAELSLEDTLCGVSGDHDDHERLCMPPVVVCAAVTLGGGVVPPGRLTDTFTFEHDVCGGPRTGYVPTLALRQRAGPGLLTVPALMAVSGAAVSPTMGRLTVRGFRLLMALFNVRLGVWLPNPLALPGVTNARQVTLPDGAPRAPTGQVSPWYRFKEAFGLKNLDDPHVYVSDGGHWENLGLVELLRRGCTTVLCLDASGDKPGRFDTLANAVALARSELGVDIEVDTTPLMPREDDGRSESMCAVGTITYPDGRPGTLLYVKTALSADTPLDAAAYAMRDRRFPRHSTMDQFFDDVRFESYRALGRAAAREAVQELARVES